MCSCVNGGWQGMIGRGRQGWREGKRRKGRQKETKSARSERSRVEHIGNKEGAGMRGGGGEDARVDS